MIYTNGLMSSIDSLFNSNMFLKDENKVNNLKGQIVSVFSEISADTTSLNSQINSNTGRIDELERKYGENHEAIVKVDSLEKINASSLNSNISLKVDKVIEENKSVETKLLHKISFKYILIVLSAILFIIFFSR